MTTSGKYPEETVDCKKETKPFVNKFINDGSFLETFKKMQQGQLSVQSVNQLVIQSNQQESQQSVTTINQDPPSSEPVKIESTEEKTINPTPSSTKIILGKRRNQKLKVGIIKRDRKETESEDNLDAWSKYMKEVRQYKEKYGDDSDKKRPLVK